MIRRQAIAQLRRAEDIQSWTGERLLILLAAFGSIVGVTLFEPKSVEKIWQESCKHAAFTDFVILSSLVGFLVSQNQRLRRRIRGLVVSIYLNYVVAKVAMPAFMVLVLLLTGLAADRLINDISNPSGVTHSIIQNDDNLRNRVANLNPREPSSAPLTEGDADRPQAPGLSQPSAERGRVFQMRQSSILKTNSHPIELHPVASRTIVNSFTICDSRIGNFIKCRDLGVNGQIY